AAVTGTLAQDGRSGQPSLRALECQHLEEPAVIVHGPAPFPIVVTHVVRIGSLRPPTTATGSPDGGPCGPPRCSLLPGHGQLLHALSCPCGSVALTLHCRGGVQSGRSTSRAALAASARVRLRSPQ